ncbi:MAG: hypothetical protein JW709_07425 [Sedimentisphaerales bacterium]|nr:hypothetical protein [Sedimentisphaerales bacterium]
MNAIIYLDGRQELLDEIEPLWEKLKGRELPGRKIIGVAAGNEQTFQFYARFGFFPRCMILAQK